MTRISVLDRFGYVCSQGREFAEQFDTLEDAWRACPRGDWMLWLAYKLCVPLKTLTLAKGLCANTVRHLMRDKRSLKAVDTAIAFGRGRATRAELDAANAAAYAANAANAAANAANAAAYAAANAGRSKNQRETADICRRVLTRSVFARLRKLKKEVEKGSFSREPSSIVPQHERELAEAQAEIERLTLEIENKQYTITCASEENQQLKESLAEAQAEIEKQDTLLEKCLSLLKQQKEGGE